MFLFHAPLPRLAVEPRAAVFVALFLILSMTYLLHHTLINSMDKKDSFEVKGVITEVLPNTVFRAKLENGRIITAHISGRLRKNYIRILAGDHVTMKMSPYDLNRGRIVYRTK